MKFKIGDKIRCRNSALIGHIKNANLFNRYSVKFINWENDKLLDFDECELIKLLNNCPEYLKNE